MALACLAVFYLSVIFSGKFDFSRWALNMGAGRRRASQWRRSLPALRHPGHLRHLAVRRMAVPGHRAIAAGGRGIARSAARHAEGHHRRNPDPDRLGFPGDLPEHRHRSAGAAGLSRKSTEPLLDGFRALFGSDIAKILAAVAVIGLIASFHTIIFAYGRQIYSLSRAGYFPAFLSVTHGTRKSPHVALIAGAVLGLAVMLITWFSVGRGGGAALSSAARCSTWRWPARCSPTSCRACPTSF